LLKKLTIQNYALVDRIEIEFKPGFTVLTGETGAGKSVILGGLLLALGDRGDREFIRHGETKASAETVFDLSKSSHLQHQIREQLGSSIDSELCISRDIAATGSSKGYIQGHSEGLSKIREIASRLADFQSQQGQRHLLDIERHLEFLDGFAGLTKEREKLAELHAEFSAVGKQLDETKRNAQATREKLELINFQIDELTKASVRIGEESDLEEERKRLESVRSLMETGQAVLAAVAESDNSILSTLSQLDKPLRQAAGIDKQLASEASLLSETIISLNELTRNLESYLSRLEDNPERLEEINARLAELYRLRKKYGTDEAGMIAKLEELKGQSLGAGDIDSLIKSLSQKLEKARKDYFELAQKVSAKRKTTAVELEKKVERELTDLAMAKTRFKIDFSTEPDENGFEISGEKTKAYPHGLENAEFLISTNPNEPLRPLVKIASGGELSRIMLALLTSIAGKYKLPTIIFDEIDTGIGGQTAKKLGQKLKELSTKHQVITISHLRAVAEQADHHLAVDKSLKNGRHVITVREITGAELKKELARMDGKAERSLP